MKKRISSKGIAALKKEFEKQGIFSAPPRKSFCCPICGSKDYSTAYGDNGVCGPGFRSWILYYECSGCSVRFGALEKFTKK